VGPAARGGGCDDGWMVGIGQALTLGLEADSSYKPRSFARTNRCALAEAAPWNATPCPGETHLQEAAPEHVNPLEKYRLVIRCKVQVSVQVQQARARSRRAASCSDWVQAAGREVHVSVQIQQARACHHRCAVS
jgi:hypothetical protein